MLPAPIPVNEEDRMADLRALEILDTPAERRFDRIVELASEIFQVPMAFVALIDHDRQWFKSKHGAATDETAREVSF